MIAQPELVIPPEIQAGLLDNRLKLFGSVVRQTDSGRIVKHLKYATPRTEPAEKAVNELRFNRKVVISVAMLTLGGVATHLMQKRRVAKSEVVEQLPECLLDFESSLKEYIEAGRSGALTSDVVDRLIQDLDAVKQFSETQEEVRISLEQLVPLFEMVLAHTSRLAQAYDVDGAGLERDVEQDTSEVVVTLRRHLQLQRKMLKDAA